MKIAHLILAHQNPVQLKRLVDRLSCNEAVFFLHIDQKVDIRVFTEIFSGNEQVNFIRNRVSITWASFSMVQATLNGFEEIKLSGFKIAHINLLSGQDYPLRPINEFHEFLKQHSDKAFMHCLDVNSEWTEAISRLEQYHLTYFINFPGKYILQKLINKVLPKRSMPENMIAVGRSQWFTITFPQMLYILKKMQDSKSITQFFKFTWAPDEIIFQTILFNSEFKPYIVNDNLRHIDWSKKGENPKLLLMEDLPALLGSSCFFARKFDRNIDEKVLDLIDQNLGSKSID